MNGISPWSLPARAISGISVFLLRGVVLDFAIGQRLLQLGNLGPGEVGVVLKFKLLQILEPRQGTDIGELVFIEDKI